MMNSLILGAFKEAGLALIGRLAFRVLAERFFTRLIIYSLDKLVSYTSNTMIEETAHDIKLQLKGKKLKVIDDSVSNKL